MRTQQIVDGVAITSSGAPGSRAPVLLVHSGAHGAWQWDPWLPWLARAGRTVLALDWYSHGASRRLEREEWLQRGILDVQTEIGIGVDQSDERPVLVGHSMGGLASLAYAVHHPGRVAALVLLAPVAPARYGGAPVKVPIDFDRPWAVPPFDLARDLWFDTAPPDHHAAIYELLQAESPRAVWEATRWTAELDVSTLDVPALVVSGARDVLTPPGIVGALARGIDASLITLEDVGHGLVVDPSWPALWERVEGWLDEAVPRITRR